MIKILDIEYHYSSGKLVQVNVSCCHIMKYKGVIETKT